MSLINEALKEARHEATRQDNRRGSSLYPRVPRHGPRRRRRWLGWGTIGALALIVVIAAVTVWTVTKTDPQGDDVAASGDTDSSLRNADSVSQSTNSEPHPAPAGGVGPSASTPTRIPEADDGLQPATADPVDIAPSSNSSAATPTDSDLVAEPLAPPVTSPLAAAEIERRPAPPARTDETSSSTDAAPPRETAPPAASAPAGSAPTAAVESDSTYRREAQLSDGTRLTLGGIAWSPTQPVALLNGRVIGIGEKVQGFTLRQVYPREVHLARGDRTIILTTE